MLTKVSSRKRDDQIRSDFAKELLDRLDQVAIEQPLLETFIRIIKDHIREVRDK